MKPKIILNSRSSVKLTIINIITLCVKRPHCMSLLHLFYINLGIQQNDTNLKISTRLRTVKTSIVFSDTRTNSRDTRTISHRAQTIEQYRLVNNNLITTSDRAEVLHLSLCDRGPSCC